MRKALTLILAFSMCLTLSACKESSTLSASSIIDKPTNTTIMVVTSYGSEDGNRKNYETAISEYETASGNKIIDDSAVSNEEWKSKVLSSFETGTEPDVLFFFNGADANPLITGDKVVSLEEIRKEYPDYAGNMKDDLITPSPVDGKAYAVPVNGFWESMFVNTKVLKAAGVEVGGADYTWEKFKIDCQKIKAAGFTPIAVALSDIPHYWFEFAVYNNGSTENHLQVPMSVDDETGKKWVAALNDIKYIYQAGFLPEDTLTMTDDESVQMVYDGKSAFFIDGSWKVGNVYEKNPDNLDDFTVSFVPAKGNRKATDLIGGISMGYYITQKAWNDEAKREAAVQFVTHMTSNENVSKFSAVAITALVNGSIPSSDLNTFQVKVVNACAQATNLTGGAVQDALKQESRNALLVSIPLIVTGEITPEEALAQALMLNK